MRGSGPPTVRRQIVAGRDDYRSDAAAFIDPFRRGVIPVAFTLAAETGAMGPEIPLLQGLGPHTRSITTKSPLAQKYFDQGLNLLFGFAHGASIRSFKEAARLDPECAMAHWGIALASGPHINFPLVPPPMAEQAWTELNLAQKYAGNAKPADRALINRMGFKNGGVAAAVGSLRRSKSTILIGGKIGKYTEKRIERAADSYLACFRAHVWISKLNADPVGNIFQHTQ